MANSYTNENAVLEQRFQAQFEAVNTTIKCFYENGPDAARPTKDTSFVRFYVIPGEGNPIALGTVMERRVGLIQINIYTPQGKGSGPARAIADLIEPIFKLVDILVPSTNDLIRMRTSHYHNVGERDGHYTAVMTIPYQYDTL